MSCLSPDQIERLALKMPGRKAVDPMDDQTASRLKAHVGQCAACAEKLRRAESDAALIDDVNELRESRESIKPLLDEMTAFDPGLGPNP